MRLSDKSKETIKEMEAKGYVWLSHLDVNTQMRFRNMTRKGFDKYVKIDGPGKSGLTFLTKEVADIIQCGASKDGRRATVYEQLEFAKNRIAELESKVSYLEGVISGDSGCKNQR
nr:MAG TPA: hypothetical protein [Caudoviricetes sp.]